MIPSTIAPQDTAVGSDEPLRLALLAGSEISDALLGEMVALNLRSFPRWPAHDPQVPLEDYLRWKVSSPGGGGAVVGWVGPRVVTSHFVVLYPIHVRGVKRLSVDLPDLVVDPEHRGKGFSNATTAWVDAHGPPSDLQIDDTRDSRLLKARRRRSARPFGNRVRSLHLARDPRRLLRGLAPGGAAPRLLIVAWMSAIAGASRLRALLARPPRATGELRDVARFDRRADVLFERMTGDFDLIFDGGSERLNWRYRDRRAGPFIARAVEEDGELTGYAVWRVDPPLGWLADLRVAPGRLDAAEALVLDGAARLDVGALSCWLPHRHPYRPLLRRLGFVAKPGAVPLRYRPQRLSAADLAFLDQPDARLHLTIGDTDTV